MKWKLLLFTALTLGTLAAAPPAHAVTLLDDKALGAVRGGFPFCVNQKCETGAPSGVCQPYPDDPEDICKTATCKFDEETLGGRSVAICLVAGKYTCTASHNYRKCVMSLTLTTCVMGTDNLYCGLIYDPVCHVNIEERRCDCTGHTSTDPCEWTSCLLESQ